MTFLQEKPGTKRKRNSPPANKTSNKHRKMDDFVNSALSSFTKQQEASQKLMMEWEERQMEKEREREDLRRREDHDHELRMFGMTGQLLNQLAGQGQEQRRHTPSQSSGSSISFSQDGSSFFNM